MTMFSFFFFLEKLIFAFAFSVVKCSPVTEPRNGKAIGVLDIDREFSYGQVVRFECNSGFMLDGPKEIHCSTNGDWNDAIPECVGKVHIFYLP